jgi:hypothetical protein
MRDLVAEQMALFALPPPQPKRTAVEALREDPQPTAVGGSLDRMTWQDDVELGDAQTPAAALPAWKLSFNKGDTLLLRAKSETSRRITAVVLHTAKVGKDFTLPVLVQVEIHINGGPAVNNTTIPATAVDKHVGGV